MANGNTGSLRWLILMLRSYASLISVIYEFGKLDIDSSSIQEFLSEQGLPETHTSAFLNAYTNSNNIFVIRKMLASTGFHFPHIVDVDWRVDYAIKSDSLEKLNSPTFFVKLKTRQNGVLQNVEFTASLEQMQDLVRKLKDATVSLERLDMSQ